MVEYPVEIEIEQAEESSIIMGEAEHGRVRFTAQIDDSVGLVEEHAFVSSLETALEDSIVRERTETVQD